MVHNSHVLSFYFRFTRWFHHFSVSPWLVCVQRSSAVGQMFSLPNIVSILWEAHFSYMQFFLQKWSGNQCVHPQKIILYNHLTIVRTGGVFKRWGYHSKIFLYRFTISTQKHTSWYRVNEYMHFVCILTLPGKQWNTICMTITNVKSKGFSENFIWQNVIYKHSDI